MLATQRPAHVVNTASIGGFQVNPNFLTAAYSMTKYAVVALSEGLHNELQGTQVGVSILAPAAVDTRIHLSERSRPDRLGGATVRPQNHFMGDLIKGSMPPQAVGEDVGRDVERGVDHQTQAQLVDRQAGTAHAVAHRRVACLQVRQDRLHFPQAFGPGMHLHLQGSAMLEPSLRVWGGQGHGCLQAADRVLNPPRGPPE
jgi:short-subunit dehydrogenase